MHKKYAAQGLAAISVALDDPADQQAKDAVLKFLKKEKATFTNVILNEQPELWQEKLKSPGPPFFYVFNREGKYKKFEGGDIDEDLGNIDKLVAEWLKQK
jgi:hypothetical protein